MALGNKRYLNMRGFKKMKKDIRTHEAKIDLVKKFLDYANCAYASYALLESTHKNTKLESL